MPGTSNTQENFDLLLMIVLCLNLLFFLSITFSPSIYRNMGNWASRIIDRLWHRYHTGH